MQYTAKSYLESGNLTRGDYGVKPVLVRVRWLCLAERWIEDEDGYVFGAFDPDFGWMAPWPPDDVIEDPKQIH